jgi:hypothetical protein
MKKLLFILPLALLVGCGTLIPKRVEFFQKKVTGVPEKSTAQIEKEKEAAYAASLVARVTAEAAAANHDPVTVTVPAQQTVDLTAAVSTSLGPPKNVPNLTPPDTTKLSDSLVEKKGSLDSKIAAYSEKIEPLVGKKIEGTGLIRIPYFIYLGCIALVLFLVWTGLKLYGAVNPAVGLGVNSVGRIGGSILSRGFSEVVKGGEDFKAAVKASPLTAEVKTAVLDLFQRHAMQAQSQDTQRIVQNLTVPTVGT